VKEITIDPFWFISGLVLVIGAGVGWYIVRLDTLVEELRKDVIRLEKSVGGLENANVNCVTDQTILKKDMSHIRSTLLKMVSHRFMRKQLRAEWKEAKRAAKQGHRQLSATHHVQLEDR